jgi:hypothetical protein
MKNRKSFLTVISDIDSNLKNNKLNFTDNSHQEIAKIPYCNDKSAIEDYKSLKTEIDNLNLEMRPGKLAYQEVRIRNYYNK